MERQNRTTRWLGRILGWPLDGNRAAPGDINNAEALDGAQA